MCEILYVLSEIFVFFFGVDMISYLSFNDLFFMFLYYGFDLVWVFEISIFYVLLMMDIIMFFMLGIDMDIGFDFLFEYFFVLFISLLLGGLYDMMLG